MHYQYIPLPKTFLIYTGIALLLTSPTYAMQQLHPSKIIPIKSIPQIGAVTYVALHQNLCLITTKNTTYNAAYLCNLATGECEIKSIGSFLAATITPQNKPLVITTRFYWPHNTAYLLNIQTGKTAILCKINNIFSTFSYSYAKNTNAISKSGNQKAMTGICCSGSGYNTILLYDKNNKETRIKNCWINNLSFSPDENLLIATHSTICYESARLYNMQGECIAILKANRIPYSGLKCQRLAELWFKTVLKKIPHTPDLKILDWSKEMGMLFQSKKEQKKIYLDTSSNNAVKRFIKLPEQSEIYKAGFVACAGEQQVVVLFKNQQTKKSYIQKFDILHQLKQTLMQRLVKKQFVNAKFNFQ